MGRCMECRVNIDKNVQSELNRRQSIFAWISFVVGLLGLIVYISLDFFIESAPWEDILLVFAIPFAIGLICLVNIHRAKVWSTRMNREHAYIFDEEKMFVTVYIQGEQSGTNEVYYRTLTHFRETKNYLFLYPNKISAFPIEKAKLSPRDYAILKVWVATAMGIK